MLVPAVGCMPLRMTSGLTPFVLAHLLPDSGRQGHIAVWIVFSAMMDSLNEHSARKFLQRDVGNSSRMGSRFGNAGAPIRGRVEPGDDYASARSADKCVGEEFWRSELWSRR